MADISTYIRQIEIASRGEEVRDSIVGALNGMNNSIPGSVTDALEEAKESGDFDGADGVGIKRIVLNSDYTLTITLDDDRSFTTTSVRGQAGAKGDTGSKGDTGPAGSDGVSPVVTVTAITGGHRLTVTDADHPSGQTFDILDGSDGNDGTDGSDGTDGVSPTVTIAAITGGHRVTITDADHPSGQSFDVMDGSGGGSGGSGDMTAALYDPNNDVAAAGGIPAYVEDHAQTALTFDEAPQANSTNPVKSRGIYSALGDCQSKLWKTTLSLAVNDWSSSDPYYQTVSVTGVTANSMIDIQPTAAALAQLQADGVTALWVENDNGTVKVYAKGAIPTAALSLQATVTEVSNTPFPSYNYSKWIDSVQLNADYTLTINFTNGTSWTSSVPIRGATGETGSAGPTGQTGPAGNDGISPAVSVTSITGGHRVTITDADHPSGQTFDVLDGGGSGDMQASVYDSDSAVATAGGIKAYVEDELENLDTGGLFIAKYGISTYAEVLAAYKKNKIVYCRAASGSNPASGNQLRMAFLAYVNSEDNPTEFEFQYYRSVATHSAAQQGDQVFVYKLNSSTGWSVTTREAATKIAVGSGLTTSYSNGTLTISLA